MLSLAWSKIKKPGKMNRAIKKKDFKN